MFKTISQLGSSFPRGAGFEKILNSHQPAKVPPQEVDMDDLDLLKKPRKMI